MKVLAVTGGHRVDLDAFLGMLGAICAERGWSLTHAVQPDAQRWFSGAHRGTFDAILCHDIPGLALKRGTPPTPHGPTEAVTQGLLDLLEAGQGLVFLHHALAGWPGWAEWAEVLGGRYHYAPGTLRGEAWPDSGYRYAHYTARVAEHPVTRGVGDFELDDELYCCPVFAEDVVPLLRVAGASAGEFHQTYAEVLGEPGSAWQHPAPSELIGWAKTARNSPLVYLQPGDGPATFANPHFRRLLGNALAWVASAEAHAWAIQNRTEITSTKEGTAWTSS